MYLFRIMARPSRSYTVKYYSDDGKWKVRLEGSSRASKVKDTKKKAVKVGKTLANKRGTSLRIFHRDGRHHETITYSTSDRAKQR